MLIVAAPIAHPFPLILNLLKDENGGGKRRMGRRHSGPSFSRFQDGSVYATAAIIRSTVDGSGLIEPSSMPCIASTMASW